jgi:hypothetical protein
MVWLRSLLFNIFNPLGQSGDLLNDLIKLLIKEGAFLSNKLRVLVLGYTIIEMYRRGLLSGAFA